MAWYNQRARSPVGSRSYLPWRFWSLKVSDFIPVSVRGRRQSLLPILPAVSADPLDCGGRSKADTSWFAENFRFRKTRQAIAEARARSGTVNIDWKRAGTGVMTRSTMIRFEQTLILDNLCGINQKHIKEQEMDRRSVQIIFLSTFKERSDYTWICFPSYKCTPSDRIFRKW